MRERGERELARRRVARYRGMRGEKDGDAGRAVIEIGAEADELKHFGVAEPVEPDPGRARAAANGMRGDFVGDLAGFGHE